MNTCVIRVGLLFGLVRLRIPILCVHIRRIMSDHAHEIVPKRCPNCDTWMSEGGAYCPGCGQKYSTGKVTVKALLQEAFEAIFNFESRTYKTFFHLFLPGRLTNEYFKGRHRRYISPLRLFLLMAILHFAVLAFVLNVTGGNDMQKIERAQERMAFRSELGTELDTLIADIKSRYFPENAQVEAAFDSLVQHLAIESNDSTLIGNLDFFPYEGGQYRVPTVDIYRLNPDQFLDKYKVEGFFNRMVVRQELKMMNQVGSLAGYFLSKLTWMALLMMPALALILKLIYIRRKRFYVEHLIFSFHYHAFAFLLISITALLDLWLHTDGILTGIGFLLVLLYLYLAMYAVYKQRIVKTFIKFNLLNFTYIILFTVFLTLTLMVSVFFF